MVGVFHAQAERPVSKSEVITSVSMTAEKNPSVRLWAKVHVGFNAGMASTHEQPQLHKHLVQRKRKAEMMPVKIGETNQEMTTGVKPLRNGNCMAGAGGWGRRTLFHSIRWAGQDNPWMGSSSSHEQHFRYLISFLVPGNTSTATCEQRRGKSCSDCIKLNLIVHTYTGADHCLGVYAYIQHKQTKSKMPRSLALRVEFPFFPGCPLAHGLTYSFYLNSYFLYEQFVSSSLRQLKSVPRARICESYTKSKSH